MQLRDYHKKAIPDVANNVRVTIGTLTPKQQCVQKPLSANKYVNHSEYHRFRTGKDKMYMITYNGGDWYKRSKSDNIY